MENYSFGNVCIICARSFHIFTPIEENGLELIIFHYRRLEIKLQKGNCHFLHYQKRYLNKLKNIRLF